MQETHPRMKDYSKIGDKLVMNRTRRRLEGTAMGATVFDLRPGVGIGPFSIGMRFSQKFPMLLVFENQFLVYPASIRLGKRAIDLRSGDCVLFWELYDNIFLRSYIAMC